MQNDKLLPCPFCGSDKLKMDSKNGRIHYHEKDGMKAWQNVVYSVRCNKCHARGGTVSADLPTMGILGDYKIKRDKVIEDCINKWNTRKPMERIVEQLEELKEEKNDISSKIRNAEDKRCYGFYELGIDEATDIVRKGGVDNAG